jgi:hypothetical protein
MTRESSPPDADRASATAGSPGLAPRRNSAFSIQHKNNNIGIVYGLNDLETDLVGKVILIIPRKSAGIDQGKIDVSPTGITVMTIPGNTGQVVNKGVSCSGYTIKKGRFTHIGSTHYGNDWFHIRFNDLR